MARKRRLSGPTRKKLVLELLAENNRCHWCPKELDEFTATLDHIITIAEGGDNKRENQTLSCSRCNQERGATSYGEFHKRRFPPKTVLKMSHEAFEKCGTSMDDVDLELAKLELGTRVAGAMLKENAKPLRERYRSAIKARFKVISKILDEDTDVAFFIEPENVEHCFYTHDKNPLMNPHMKRFIRTWGDKPFKDLE